MIERFVRTAARPGGTAMVCVALAAGACSSGNDGSPDAAHDGAASDATGVDATATDGAAGSTAGLPIDCRMPSQRSDRRCVSPGTLEPGSVGRGVRLDGPPGFPQLHGGFVEQTRLLAAAENENPVYGMVVAVDLASGDRTLVSGNWTDPATGPLQRGTGPDLGRVMDVQSGPDGWYVLNYDRKVFRLDPATGNRVLVWDPTDASKACMVGDRAALPDRRWLTVGPDGTIYLPGTAAVGTTGIGILAIRRGACSIVTLQHGPSGSDRGTGPDLQTDPLRSLRYAQGALFATQFISNSLHRFDPVSGNWVRLSSVSRAVGGGDAQLGTDWLAPQGDTVLTVDDPVDGLALTVVDARTGTRRTLSPPGDTGPASSPAIRFIDPVIWAHPTRPLAYVSWSTGVVAIDVRSGSSATLTY